jgi:hypothetical protein
VEKAIRSKLLPWEGVEKAYKRVLFLGSGSKKHSKVSCLPWEGVEKAYKRVLSGAGGSIK